MVKLCILALAMMVACTAAKPFGDLLPAGNNFLGKNGNLFGIEADARVKVAGHEVGAEAGAGIGEHGIGGHGAGSADIFGQQAGTHADVLDGYPGEHHGSHDHRQQGHGYGHGY